MATGFEFFERDLKVATAGLEPEAINAAVARFAKQELHRVIAEGTGSPIYDRYVNARKGASEESYKAPGVILYEFVNWPLVIGMALDELRKRAPKKSGRFASSFIVIVGGRIVTDFAAIDGDSEVIITNFQPYVRKAEVGRLGIPKRRLFDGTKRKLNSRFSGAFKAETRFLNMPAGIHPMMPYILKGGDQRTSSISALATWHGVPKPVIEGWLRQGRNVERPRAKAGKDRTAGQPITYPAILINRL